MNLLAVCLVRSLKDYELLYLYPYLRFETLRTLSSSAVNNYSALMRRLALRGIVLLKDRRALVTAVLRARRQGRFF